MFELSLYNPSMTKIRLDGAEYDRFFVAHPNPNTHIAGRSQVTRRRRAQQPAVLAPQARLKTIATARVARWQRAT